MNKNTFTKTALTKGEMNVYNFGGIKLHAYKTNDFLSDEVFCIEKNETIVVIEPPCFKDNIAELSAYLKNFSVAGILVAYHGAGASFLPETKKYATKNAASFSKNGGGKALIDNFATTFGAAFDKSVHEITDFIEEGPITIGDIDFVTRKTADAFDIEIPEINAAYTHMLGHDCHSIVSGIDHADAIIAELEKYIARGFNLILTSHYTPEDLKDVQTKIDYLRNLKKIAAECANAEQFTAHVKKEYPEYNGENYLDMTASMLFK